MEARRGGKYFAPQISLRLAFIGTSFPKLLILKDHADQGRSLIRNAKELPSPDEEGARRSSYLPELALKVSSPRPRRRTSMARRLIF